MVAQRTRFLPRRSGSRSARRMARALGMGMNLNAMQARDATDQRRAEMSQTAEAPQPSPLELPKKSYTQTAQTSEQEQINRQMISAGETLGKGPVVPSVQAPPAAAPEQGEEQPAQSSGGERGQEETAEEESAPEVSPEAQAANLLAQQQQQQIAEQQQAAGAAEQAAAGQAKQQAAKLLEKEVNAVSAGSAITLYGIIITILILNVQLVNTLIFHSEWVPKSSLVKIALTVFVDLLLLAAVLIQLAVILGPLVIITSIAP